MFTADCLQLCLTHRDEWSGKEAVLGDWFIDLGTDDGDVVSRSALGRVDFAPPQFVYVPDTDDLLEFMDNQIRAWGMTLPRSKSRSATTRRRGGA